MIVTNLATHIAAAEMILLKSVTPRAPAIIGLLFKKLTYVDINKRFRCDPNHTIFVKNLVTLKVLHKPDLSLVRNG